MLENIVYCERGRAEMVPREIIDFNHSMAASALRKAFAKVIVERGEGLVLRHDEPYIVVHDQSHVYSGRCIKLKKEYIGTFGDIGDFALVGAGFDAAKAKTYRNMNVKWTHYYVGCLNNKEEVKRWNATPEYTVVSVVELSEALLQTFTSNCDTTAIPLAENSTTKIILAAGIQSRAPLDVAFTNPSVVDMRCFSFDKPGNTGFWTPRFPAITKFHFDRDVSDVVSLDELQAMAKESVNGPEFEDSQENRQWIANLEAADPRGIAVDAQSQLTATTMNTPSPRKSTQESRGSRNSPSSTKSASQQSEKNAVEEARKMVRIPLPPPLITPPTSSPFEEQTRQKATTGTNETTPQKRSSPPKTVPSTDSKRRRVSNDLRTIPEQRRPLGEVTANRSLCIPETQSSEDKSFHSCESQDTVRNKMSQMKDADVEDEGVVRIVEATADDSLHRNDLSAMHDSTDECIYKGAECCLGNTSFFLASKFLHRNKELVTLLEQHGIHDVTANVEDWWEAEEIRLQELDLITSKLSEGEKRILLVDSVQQAHETKAQMARLDTRRKDFRREKRDWITVYDWRVLKHVSVFENDNITKKYYDGFQDPWRRWYCGLV